MFPLLVVWCLTTEPLPTVYVYIENTGIVQDTRSEQVEQALGTPIETLRRRWPDNPNIQGHLDKLACLRSDLSNRYTVQVLNRDEAKLSWDWKLPGIIFHENRKPFTLHPESYWTPCGILEHIDYLCQIREHALNYGTSTHYYSDRINQTTDWTFWQQKSQVQKFLVTCTVPETGQKACGVKWTRRLVPFFTPRPAINMEMPSDTSYEVTTIEGKSSLERWTVPSGEQSLQVVLLALDMGTGIIIDRPIEEFYEDDYP